MKYSGTLYKSRWDAFTWGVIALVAATCIATAFLVDDGIVPFIMCVAILIIVILIMIGVYYRIDGDKLIIYQFFIPTAFPIDKISEISATTSILSAPAASLTHRIAIKFTDRSVMKSTMPLIISPVRQQEFIDQLKAINPAIKEIKEATKKI